MLRYAGKKGSSKKLWEGSEEVGRVWDSLLRR